MHVERIDHKHVGQLNALVIDYLQHHPATSDLIHFSPSMEGVLSASKERSSVDRNLLYRTLKLQYEGLTSSKQVRANIERLKKSSTFTVTTGHQLNLFTGPTYFIYKIASTIRAVEELNAAQNSFEYVPVYWMASEDHDFDEINHCFIRGNRVSWNSEETGKVGVFNPQEVSEVLTQFEELFGESWLKCDLKALFEEAYKQPTLADATRLLVDELFKDYGLVVIDADDPGLKRAFVEVVKKELVHQPTFNAVSSTINTFNEANYPTQVSPREINLFYIIEGVRERIVKVNDNWEVLNSSHHWSSESQLLSEVENFPERFSPNVLLRPVYQELILPNVAYFGGGAEVSYWLELKRAFESFDLKMPVVLLRNMNAIVAASTEKKMNQLELRGKDLFSSFDELMARIAKRKSKHELSLAKERDSLKALYRDVAVTAKLADPQLEQTAKSFEQKSLKLIDSIEKKAVRAEKRKRSVEENRLQSVWSDIYPNGTPQERKENFTSFYLLYGRTFVEEVVLHTNPFDFRFTLFYV